MDSSLYTLLFSINLSFILCNFYGGMVKCFFRPQEYISDFDKYFPTCNIVAIFYFFQLLEIPYLFMVGDPNYLYYVNAFGAMIFPALLGTIVQLYLFPQKTNWGRFSFYLLPAIVITFTLVLNAMNVIPLGDNYQTVFNWIVVSLNLLYTVAIIDFMKHTNMFIKNPDEMRKFKIESFKIETAKKIYWWPLIISLLMLVCFLFNDPFVKLVRDFTCIFLNIRLLFFTLNPHHGSLLNKDEKDGSSNKYRLSEKKCDELHVRLIAEVYDKHLYLDQNISLDTIAKILNTNKNYLSEILNRGKYGTFYNFINDCRINHAKELMKKHKNWKISEIANASGFSSPSTFSRLFKAATGVSPKDFEPKN